MERQRSRSNGSRGYNPGYGSYYNRYYGNISEAYDLAAIEEEAPRPARRRRPGESGDRYRALKKKVRERNRPTYEIAAEKAPGVSAASVFTVLVVGAFVFMWLATWGLSAVKENNLADTTAKYQTLAAENEENRRSIERRVNLAEIEQDAIDRLGMKYPDEHQKIYIDIPNESYIISFGIEEEPRPEFGFSLASIIGLFIK